MPLMVLRNSLEQRFPATRIPESVVTVHMPVNGTKPHQPLGHDKVSIPTRTPKGILTHCMDVDATQPHKPLCNMQVAY